MALQEENDRMRRELNENFMAGTDNNDEQQEMIMINNGLNQ
jgi:hypothetical protein